jgi:hypothetical protein
MRLRFRFNAPIFTAGATLLSIGSGIASLVPSLLIPAGILFAGGIVLTIAGIVTIRPADVVLHNRWDTERVYRAMERGPNDGVVRILQTWFPEENFIERLRAMYAMGKKFDLRIMLMNPGEPGQPHPLLSARVMLRPISTGLATDEIVSAINALIQLKESVDAERRDRYNRKRDTLDLEIRTYEFMPFGPIYQIAEEVMFVGLYLNHTTSAEAPMLEIRNTPHNRLWRLFEQQFNDGWSAETTRVVYPAGVPHQRQSVAQ